jgi:uridine kinase
MTGQTAGHLKPLAALADLCRDGPARAGDTRVVGVDGPSGSGKSTLAARLAEELACPVVHMDDLYPGWDGLEDAAPRLLEWVLEPLAAGANPRYRRYDWVAGAYAEWHDVPTTGLLLVEGVSCGARRPAAFLSTLVWVDAVQAERFRRGIERDGETYRPYWQRWADQEDRHFAAEHTQERADVVVDGQLDLHQHAAGLVRVRRWPGGADPPT